MLLSTRREFVVQIAHRPGSAAGAVAGRVEHVATGHAERFETAEGLLAFFARVLGGESSADRHSQAGERGGPATSTELKPTS